MKNSPQTLTGIRRSARLIQKTIRKLDPTSINAVINDCESVRRANRVKTTLGTSENSTTEDMTPTIEKIQHYSPNCAYQSSSSNVNLHLKKDCESTNATSVLQNPATPSMILRRSTRISNNVNIHLNKDCESTNATSVLQNPATPSMILRRSTRILSRSLKTADVALNIPTKAPKKNGRKKVIYDQKMATSEESMNLREEQSVTSAQLTIPLENDDCQLISIQRFSTTQCCLSPPRTRKSSRIDDSCEPSKTTRKPRRKKSSTNNRRAKKSIKPSARKSYLEPKVGCAVEQKDAIIENNASTNPILNAEFNQSLVISLYVEGKPGRPDHRMSLVCKVSDSVGHTLKQDLGCIKKPISANCTSKGNESNSQSVNELLVQPLNTYEKKTAIITSYGRQTKRVIDASDTFPTVGQKCMWPKNQIPRIVKIISQPKFYGYNVNTGMERNHLEPPWKMLAQVVRSQNTPLMENAEDEGQVTKLCEKMWQSVPSITHEEVMEINDSKSIGSIQNYNESAKIRQYTSHQTMETKLTHFSIIKTLPTMRYLDRIEIGSLGEKNTIQKTLLRTIASELGKWTWEPTQSDLKEVHLFLEGKLTFRLCLTTLERFTQRAILSCYYKADDTLDANLLKTKKPCLKEKHSKPDNNEDKPNNYQQQWKILNKGKEVIKNESVNSSYGCRMPLAGSYNKHVIHLKEIITNVQIKIKINQSSSFNIQSDRKRFHFLVSNYSANPSSNTDITILHPSLASRLNVMRNPMPKLNPKIKRLLTSLGQVQHLTKSNRYIDIPSLRGVLDQSKKHRHPEGSTLDNNLSKLLRTAHISHNIQRGTYYSPNSRRRYALDVYNTTSRLDDQKADNMCKTYPRSLHDCAGKHFPNELTAPEKFYTWSSEAEWLKRSDKVTAAVSAAQLTHLPFTLCATHTDAFIKDSLKFLKLTNKYIHSTFKELVELHHNLKELNKQFTVMYNFRMFQENV